MNKNKRTMKGFTLIELIIVIAIFSVIMTLVMSFIDPVSRIMTKTSVRERTAAYVDNIGDYVSKSIRHAQNINVYDNGFFDSEGTLITEEDFVKSFVDTYYDGAVDEDLTPLKGKVHVLKLINTDVTESYGTDTDTLEAGRIYESVYDFTTGVGKQTIVYFDPSTNSYVDKGEHTHEEMIDAGYTALTKITYDNNKFKHSVPSIVSRNVSVINEEHFKDYSYYYKLGMYTLDPIPDHPSGNDKYFYSRLNQVTDSSGTIIGDSINEYQFVMNIVSFMPEQKDGLDSIVDYTYKDDEGNDVTVPSFRSPAAMSSVGMTLKNAQMQKESRSIKYYRKKLKEDGTPETKDGKEIIEAVTNNLGAASFKRISGGSSDNIYIIYTVPSEIEDTEWDWEEVKPTSGGPLV